MDPASALIIALVAAWYAVSAQAKVEAHAAAEAIRKDLRNRRDEWARRLEDRIAGGRAGGPATGLWWAWAAVRTAQALRGGLRREPLEREPSRAIRGETGPFRRIWDAGTAGARYAWSETRRPGGQQHDGPDTSRPGTDGQRAPGGDHQQQRRRIRMGVCPRCGAVVSDASLASAPGVTGRVCVACRNELADRDATANPEPTEPPAADEEDTVDADVVDQSPRQIKAPRPELNAGPAEAAKPETTASNPPSGPSSTPPPPHTPVPQSTPAPAVEEGAPMAPRQPGQIVLRNPHAPASAVARGNGGESYTHGQWNRSVADIHERLKALPGALELMLRRLTAAEAGRSQVRGVLQLHADIALFMEQVTDMLREVNRLEQPVLNAVEAAGGPDEIAGIPYLSDV